MFGRNYDFYYSVKKFSESYLTLPKDGYCSIGHSDIFVGRDDGINEKGLVIALTGVRPKNPVKPGINFLLATRCIIDKCANLKEAIETISDFQFTRTNNYLLADREGNMAVVEASQDRVRTRRPKDGERFIVCTNHFLHSEMLEMENRKERA